MKKVAQTAERLMVHIDVAEECLDTLGENVFKEDME